MIEKKNRLLLIASAVLLAACGGGGGSTTHTTTTFKVVDDILVNATGFCDSNKNGVLDAGENFAFSNSQGVVTLSAACASPSNIAAFGGTGVDTGLPFPGVLTAPAGSTVVTVLTSLVTAGLSNVQTVQFAGLPAGTDVNHMDPTSDSSVMRKTLALQQILLQGTGTIAALAVDSTAPVAQASYAAGVSAMATVSSANPTTPLISSAGAVSPALVSSIVQQSVNNVANSSDSRLSVAKGVIATYSPVSVAEVAAAPIAAEAEILATSSSLSTVTVSLMPASLSTASLQSDVTVPNAVSQAAPLLTTAHANVVDMTAFGAALRAMILAADSGDSPALAAAKAAASAAAAAQSAAAGVAVSVNPDTFNTPTNYLSILNDTININGTGYTLTQFKNGISFVGSPNASLDTVGFTFNVVGTPVPANGATVSMGIELLDSTTGRVAQMKIDKVNITIDVNKKISINVPADAKAYAYGKTSAGATGNLTLSNLDANTISVDSNNAVSFNMGLLFAKIASATDAANQAVFGSLQNVKGTFAVKFVMSGIDLREQNAFAPNLFVSVTDSGQIPVTGRGEAGIVTIQ